MHQCLEEGKKKKKERGGGKGERQEGISVKCISFVESVSWRGENNKTKY